MREKNWSALCSSMEILISGLKEFVIFKFWRVVKRMFLGQPDFILEILKLKSDVQEI